MEQKGILTIFLVLSHRDLETCEDKVIQTRVFRDECTLQQAKGLIADYKGMNPALVGNIRSTWCQRVYL